MKGITAEQVKDDDPERDPSDDEAPETPLDEPPPVPVQEPPPTPDRREPYVVASPAGLVPAGYQCQAHSTHAPEV